MLTKIVRVTGYEQYFPLICNFAQRQFTSIVRGKSPNNKMAVINLNVNSLPFMLLSQLVFF